MTMLDNHYLKMKKMYSDCNVVLENLEITYIQENQDLSFLQVSPVRVTSSRQDGHVSDQTPDKVSKDAATPDMSN